MPNLLKATAYLRSFQSKFNLFEIENKFCFFRFMY